MNTQNPWDILGNKFNTHLKKGYIDPRVADNILIAWPPILKLITKEYPNPKEIKVLDYGCGTGGFCNKLFEMDFDVTGIDPSVEMIKISRQNSPKSIHYVIGNESDLSSIGKFQIIVSIMTFPFIDGIKTLIRLLADVLYPGGLLIIADFNKDWVKECLKAKVSFADFDSLDDPHNGWKTFGDIRIPVFIRQSTAYNEYAKQNNLIQISEEYPPFTKDFNQKYPDKRPKNFPEYMILGYKKGSL